MRMQDITPEDAALFEELTKKYTSFLKECETAKMSPIKVVCYLLSRSAGSLLDISGEENLRDAIEKVIQISKKNKRERDAQH